MNNSSSQAHVSEQAARQEHEQDLPLWQPQYPRISKYPRPLRRGWKYATIGLLVLIITCWIVGFALKLSALAIIGFCLIIPVLICACLI